MNLSKLEKILAGEPAYRLKQAKYFIFKNLIGDWREAKNLPVELRQKLYRYCPLAIQGELFSSIQPSQSSAVAKALITLHDSSKIETVLMRHNDSRHTVCVSSQVGCPLRCTFCATGQVHFKRNLEAAEIVEQVLWWARRLKKENSCVTNVVFMGMGEPFLNYDNVLAAIRILNDRDGLAIGARHISISTCGIVEGIQKLAKEKLQINLAISLHAPVDELRTRLMPINKQYPIHLILEAADEYIARTKKRVMFEYVLLKGVNDSDEQAEQLAKLLKKPLYFVNLIVYNPTGRFDPPSGERVKRFKEILKKHGVVAVQRYRFGSGIKAACGQLVGE